MPQDNKPEAPLEQKKTLPPGNGDGEEEDKKEVDPLASVGDVFSFIPNTKTKIYIIVGLFCAVVSGCVFPGMAWLFSDAFTDLSAGLETGSKDPIREMAFQFMGLGYVFATFSHLSDRLSRVICIRLCVSIRLFDWIWCVL